MNGLLDEVGQEKNNFSFVQREGLLFVRRFYPCCCFSPFLCQVHPWKSLRRKQFISLWMKSYSTWAKTGRVKVYFTGQVREKNEKRKTEVNHFQDLLHRSKTCGPFSNEPSIPINSIGEWSGLQLHV